MNIDDLVKKYIEVRDFMKIKAEAFDAEMKPYSTALVAIEGALAMEMDRLGADSIKTEHGTPYRSTIMSPKVTDRDAFLDFVAAENAFEFFTAAIAKEAVKTYMEEHGDALPPGVEVAYIKKINIRRA